MGAPGRKLTWQRYRPGRRNGNSWLMCIDALGIPSVPIKRPGTGPTTEVKALRTLY